MIYKNILLIVLLILIFYFIYSSLQFSCIIGIWAIPYEFFVGKTKRPLAEDTNIGYTTTIISKLNHKALKTEGGVNFKIFIH